MKLVISVTASKSALLIRGQARYFRKQGYEVYLISSPGPEMEALAREEGARYCPVYMERGASPLKDLISLFKIVATLRRLQPDVVNAGTPKAGLLLMLAAFLLGIPRRVYTCRGLRYDSESGLKRKILMAIESLSGQLAHRVVCVGPSLREQAVLQDRVFEPAKCVVIHKGSSNGVDLQRFDPRRIDPAGIGQLRERYGIGPGDVVLGFVGRLIERKGINELVAAFRRLSKRDERLKLLLVGGFEADQRPSKTTIELIHSHPKIISAGFQSEVQQYFAMMDLFVFPAYWEGFCNVLIQAAAMGLPIVTTRVTGCSDATVDGYNGILIPDKDVPAIVDAVERYLQNEALRLKHGRQGTEWAQHFRPELIWGGLDELYHCLVLRPNRRTEEQKN